MREFILPTITQQFAQNYQLKPVECFVLDYLIQFFASGYANYIRVDNDSYFWIDFKKFLEDMPFLKIGKRQFQRIICDLESRKVLKRVLKKNRLYININLYLFECDKNVAP